MQSKPLKIFLITVFILLLGALGVVGYVWVKFQGLTTDSDVIDVIQDLTKLTEPQTQVLPVKDRDNSKATNEDEVITIDTSAISEGQKAVAKKVGIDLEEVTLTQEMVTCAEDKIGEQRIQDITQGASPTTLESISLLGCI